MSLINPSEECIAMVLKEYGTTMQRLTEDAKTLRQWLLTQPHLPHTSDEKTLVNTLIRCKNSMERAKQTIDMHYTLKASVPEFFAQRDPLQQKLNYALKNILVVPLPQPTRDGYRVTLTKNLIKDPHLYFPEMLMKIIMMTADLRMQTDAATGEIIIYDCEYLGMGHISKISLPFLKKAEICSSKAYRARIKGAHFINSSPLIDLLFSTIKKVLQNKLAMRHHVHIDMESLYEHVDRDILPVEYGGKEKSLAELSDDWQQRIIAKRDWFIDQEKNGIAIEAKRPGKRFCTSDLFGFEGTFKKLDFD